MCHVPPYCVVIGQLITLTHPCEYMLAPPFFLSNCPTSDTSPAINSDTTDVHDNVIIIQIYLKFLQNLPSLFLLLESICPDHQPHKFVQQQKELTAAKPHPL